jgi:hypothetical protein
MRSGAEIRISLQILQFRHYYPRLRQCRTGYGDNSIEKNLSDLAILRRGLQAQGFLIEVIEQ